MNGFLSYLPLIIMFGLFALNVPVAFSLAISGMVYFIFICHDLPIDMLVQALVASTESYPLLAIPFFITGGVLMSYAGISTSLLDFADVLVGHRRGGLAQTNCLLSTFMGGVSGSPIADCAFESKVLVPSMVRKGYSKGFSAAITAASSVITPIIPPGICLVMYATATNQSIGSMFAAGYVPGILMCIALMIVCDVICKRRRYQEPHQRAGGKQILRQALTSVWALFLPFGIILGMRFGLFTPTECGAMVVVYAAVVGFLVYRKLRWRDIPRILVESAVSTATVMFIMACAGLFTRYLSWEQIPSRLSQFLVTNMNNKYVFLLFVNLLLLVMGMFFDANAALVIFPALLAPVAKSLGINLVHFGIVMCINITIGGVTPPYGILMFTTQAVTKVKISEYVREGWPLIVTLLVILLLVTYVPGLCLLFV